MLQTFCSHLKHSLCLHLSNSLEQEFDLIEIQESDEPLNKDMFDEIIHEAKPFIAQVFQAKSIVNSLIQETETDSCKLLYGNKCTLLLKLNDILTIFRDKDIDHLHLLLFLCENEDIPNLSPDDVKNVLGNEDIELKYSTDMRKAQLFISTLYTCKKFIDNHSILFGKEMSDATNKLIQLLTFD